MKKLLPSIILVTLAAIVVTGCATRAKTPPAQPLRTVRVENLSHLISSGEPLQAIQEILTLERSGSSDIPLTQLSSLLERAKTKVSELFHQAIGAENYERAYSLYLSAGRYEKAAFPTWSQGKLLLALAESYKNRGMDIPALLTFSRALQQKADVGSALAEFGKLAAYETDRPILKEIVDLLRSEGKAVPQEYQKLLAQKVKPSDVVSGVVTIWVNRGIKVQNGVGVPDRVIGSGFFIDKQGYLITNYHVIESEVNPKYEGFSRLYVKLYNDQTMKIPAKVVGYDKVFDIALLKVEITPSFVLSFSSNQNPQPGDSIYAIGSPGGLENTITSGIISATGRRFQQMGDTLQVDVPLNPGNSGGPLLNTQSQLIGVVFAGIQQFQGVNFAIPAHWVEKLLPLLYEGGEVQHPWIGAALQRTGQGLEVSYVLPGSPADRAGIQPGDLITSVNGTVYSRIRDIQNALLGDRSGSLISLVWSRDGRSDSGLIALGQRPFIPLKEALDRDIRRNLFAPLFGMEVELTGSFLWQDSYRVTKVYPGSIADESGLSVGDPITVKGWHVNLTDDIAVLQFSVQKQKEGFLPSEVQIGASLLVNNFI